MAIEKKVAYLEARGWRRDGSRWLNPVPMTDPVNLKWAVHHQLTEDLASGLAAYGWKGVEYSDRGYARLLDRVTGDSCALPEALRRQARREKHLVRPFTIDIFAKAMGGGRV